MMGADGMPPTPAPPVLRVAVAPALRDRIKAACSLSGETPEAFALRAMMRELELREAPLAFARAVGIDVTVPTPRRARTTDPTPATFVSPTHGESQDEPLETPHL